MATPIDMAMKNQQEIVAGFTRLHETMRGAYEKIIESAQDDGNKWLQGQGSDPQKDGMGAIPLHKPKRYRQTKKFFDKIDWAVDGIGQLDDRQTPSPPPPRESPRLSPSRALAPAKLRRLQHFHNDLMERGYRQWYNGPPSLASPQLQASPKDQQALRPQRNRGPTSRRVVDDLLSRRADVEREDRRRLAQKFRRQAGQAGHRSTVEAEVERRNSYTRVRPGKDVERGGKQDLRARHSVPQTDSSGLMRRSLDIGLASPPTKHARSAAEEKKLALAALRRKRKLEKESEARKRKLEAAAGAEKEKPHTRRNCLGAECECQLRYKEAMKEDYGKVE